MEFCHAFLGLWYHKVMTKELPILTNVPHTATVPPKDTYGGCSLRPTVDVTVWFYRFRPDEEKEKIGPAMPKSGQPSQPPLPMPSTIGTSMPSSLPPRPAPAPPPTAPPPSAPKPPMTQPPKPQSQPLLPQQPRPVNSVPMPPRPPQMMLVQRPPMPPGPPDSKSHLVSSNLAPRKARIVAL